MSEFYLMNSEGEIVSDKIFEQRNDEFLITTLDGQVSFGTNFQFLGRSLRAVSNDGYIYSAWSKDFLIHVHDPGGTHQHSIYYPHNRIELTREAAANDVIVEGRQRMVQYADLPDTWPALHSMHVDDEKRLWISTFTEETDRLEWWVLQETGELIAKFKWPTERRIAVIKNGYLYTRETDELGVASIDRYRIAILLIK